MEDNAMSLGHTVKKRFFAALVAGFLLLGGIVATLGITGTAFAMPLGGIGDFNVNFDELEGEGFSLNPEIGETGDQDEAPLVRNEIDRATIDGLHIYKDLPMPNGDWIRINITASEPTTIEGLTQDARFIDADLNFTELGIAQSNTSDMSPEDAFRENWTHEADTVTITDGELVTSYLFQNTVSIQGAQIYIDFIDEPDGGNGTTTQISTENGNGAPPPDIDNGGSDGGTQQAEVGTSDDDDATGGVLPSTAANSVLMILVGIFVASTGAVFVFRRRIFAA